MKLSKKIITIIVVIAIVAGSSVFGYLRYVNQNPYPGLVADNKVVNETIAENFVNYTNLYHIPKMAFNAITFISYQNLSSNLTIDAVLYVFYDPTGSEVVAQIGYLNVTGNVSSALRPTGVLVTVTNTWSNALNVNNVASWGGAVVLSLPPYSNVSTPQLSSSAGGGNLAFQTTANLLNQTNSGGLNRFGLGAGLTYIYNTLSNYSPSYSGANIGNETLHFTASLQGLGKPVFVTINVLLRDTG